LGVFLCNDAGLQLGASLWFRRGRHHDDGATVANLKDIGTAGKAQLFASVTRGPIVFDATLAQDIGGSKGLTLDSSASWRFAFSTRAHASFGVTASFASAKFMQTWFGVTAEQSSSSGLPEYSPSAGLKSAGPTASLSYALTPRWSLNTAIAYDVLVAKAADSPIVERRGLPTIALGVGYHFAP
jgi:outer membrane protein